MRKSFWKWLILSGITFALLLVCATVIYFYYRDYEEIPPEPVRVPVLAYNINVDSLDVIPGEVKPGQNLSMLLSPYVSPQMIDRIARETRDVFDIRRIRPGNEFVVITTKDTLHAPQYFIYEINDIDFLVYDVRDSIRAYLDRKDVDTTVRVAFGSITTSLWNTFQEKKLDIGLGLALADVYAWTIDFYGLQPGDHFKVIYEELSVDGKPVGSDKILAAMFNSNGRDNYAFRFSQDSTPTYFDENGKSLRRSFLKAPLHFSRISSRFSRSRLHPILRIRRPHFGVDYSAPSGTPVVSLGSGHVAEAGWKGGYGRFISIRHNSVYTTTYAHLSGFAKGIRAGANVIQGQVIGYVGSSGLSTGPHLDFRVYKNGSPVDPLRIESPPTDPVRSQDMATYLELVKKYRTQLDSL